MSGTLAVVPARGGSRGVPGKNLFPVGGRPLIAWTLECARRARSIERVVVSTDSPEIASVAERCGVEVPFQRPPELARDDTPGIAPLLHTLRWLEENEGTLPSWVVCLQPTSPLRTPADVDAAVELAEREGADAVVSVSPAPAHPFWMRRIEEDGRLVDLLPGAPTPARRQELSPTYALNGAIYVARREFLLEHESFEAGRTLAYVMPPERSIDIDSAWDLQQADWCLRLRQPRPPMDAADGVDDPI